MKVLGSQSCSSHYISLSGSHRFIVISYCKNAFSPTSEVPIIFSWSQDCLNVQSPKSLLILNVIPCKLISKSRTQNSRVQQHKIYVTILQERRGDIVRNHCAKTSPIPNRSNSISKFCIPMSHDNEVIRSPSLFSSVAFNTPPPFQTQFEAFLGRRSMTLVSPTLWNFPHGPGSPSQLHWMASAHLPVVITLTHGLVSGAFLSHVLVHLAKKPEPHSQRC